MALDSSSRRHALLLKMKPSRSAESRHERLRDHHAGDYDSDSDGEGWGFHDGRLGALLCIQSVYEVI